MGASDDTEITLGTGKMLVLFFGLVILCAVFFGMGFKLGKNSVPVPTAADASTGTAAVPGGARPSANKANPPASNPDLSFYKSVGQKNSDAQLAAAPAKDSSKDQATGTASNSDSAPRDPAVAPPLNGYFVQVAAVSKQEDAEALVDALKKKQYPAFALNSAPDKLFHVQVGPYSDIKEAETMRGKLVSDGYNPILKK